MDHRTVFGLMTLHEQREVRDVPVVRRQGKYPTTPVWWELVEVPRGLAARVPQMVVLQGSPLMGESLGGPYHLMLATLRAAEVADVFVRSIRHHGQCSCNIRWGAGGAGDGEPRSYGAFIIGR